LLNICGNRPKSSRKSSSPPEQPDQSLDVTLFGNVRFRMTQDALDDFFIRAQLKQVRCYTASARIPAVPLQPNCLHGRADDFVHGVKPYLYLERLNVEMLRELGLSGNAEEKEADLFVRIPGNRESVFRGVVRKDGVPVSDILQIWLDVSQHPSRGKEQGDLIWREILSPAFELHKP
jgi:hypothetical protein